MVWLRLDSNLPHPPGKWSGANWMALKRTKNEPKTIENEPKTVENEAENNREQRRNEAFELESKLNAKRKV